MHSNVPTGKQASTQKRAQELTQELIHEPILHGIFSFQCVGEDAVILYALMGDIQTKNSACQKLTHQALNATIKPEWVYDLVPSYDSVIVHFDCMYADQHDVYQWLAALDKPSNESKSLVPLALPICYTLDRENDLAELSSHTGLEIDEVVELHSRCNYNVYALGFAPGFGYLGFVPPALQTPRKATPRTKVPKGAVAIADRQTAIYPSQSPGGWNIVGYCPLSILDRDHQPISPFAVGQTVKFKPITESQFFNLEDIPWHEIEDDELYE